MTAPRGTARLVLATFALLVMRSMGACSANDNGSSDSGTIVSDVGTCPTTYDASNGKYAHAALPSGQTCPPSTACHMAIDDCASDWSPGGGGATGQNLSEYQCNCVRGAWSCYAAIKVDTECIADAGIDASADAGDDTDGNAPLDATIFDASDAGD